MELQNYILFIYATNIFLKITKISKKWSKVKFWVIFFTNFDFLVNFDNFIPFSAYLLSNINRKCFCYSKMGLYLKIKQKIKQMVKFWKKKVFLVKNEKEWFRTFFFLNFTVCLVFPWFSNINPFWNHKSISYSYLIINKFGYG